MLHIELKHKNFKIFNHVHFWMMIAWVTSLQNKKKTTTTPRFSSQMQSKWWRISICVESECIFSSGRLVALTRNISQFMFHPCTRCFLMAVCLTATCWSYRGVKYFPNVHVERRKQGITWDALGKLKTQFYSIQFNNTAHLDTWPH